MLFHTYYRNFAHKFHPPPPKKHVGEGEVVVRGNTKKLLGVTEVFIILFAVVSQVKAYQIIHLKCVVCQFIYQ